jgi:hypothetical protein
LTKPPDRRKTQTTWRCPKSISTTFETPPILGEFYSPVNPGRFSTTGYCLDLRDTNLQRAALPHLNFSLALLYGSRMEGAELSWVKMEGADLRFARLERANLIDARIGTAEFLKARMEGVNLSGARMKGADLRETRLEGADLSNARMEEAELRSARLEGVQLTFARMEGAILMGTDLKSANWTGAQTGSPAQSADFRDATILTQEQLDQMTGNSETLLPVALFDGTHPSIPSCWNTPPKFFDAMIDSIVRRGHVQRKLRAKLLCPSGQDPQRTGTSLALDAPYPDGHPLAIRD